MSSRVIQIANFFQHGESMLNLEGRIGGDALLSHRGEEYAAKLPDLVRGSVGVSARP